MTPILNIIILFKSFPNFMVNATFVIIKKIIKRDIKLKMGK